MLGGSRRLNTTDSVLLQGFLSAMMHPNRVERSEEAPTSMRPHGHLRHLAAAAAPCWAVRPVLAGDDLHFPLPS